VSECRVGELVIECEVEPWRRIGLVVDEHGVAQVGGVRLRFVPGTRGLVGWGLVDCPTSSDTIDGLPTHSVDAATTDAPAHPLGILGFDHVVVSTSSLERTCGAIEAATGAPLKRIREAGAIRQGFHRLGEIIVEVVETAQVTAPEASFWGFVWNLADLHESCDRLGPDLVSLPKAAVQPGRFIATVRSGAGLRLPLAFMTA
jgi:hypothetical protein